MQDQAIRLVCFDLGGVVVRICRTFDEALGRAGLHERRAGIDPSFSIHDLGNAYQCGQLSTEEFAQRVSDQLAGVLAPDEVLAVHDAVILDPYEGVEAIVQELSDLHLMTAALSNINERHWPAVRHLPAITRMNHHLLSHEIGAIKPDERAYGAVERATNTAPESIIFFDDTIENIEAAAERGWRAVHIDHRRSTAEQVRRALRATGVLP